MNRYEREIVTSFIYPPIPIRTYDWCAYRDGDEERSDRYGWGRTEEEAIANLLRDEEGEKTDAAYEQMKEARHD